MQRQHQQQQQQQQQQYQYRLTNNNSSSLESELSHSISCIPCDYFYLTVYIPINILVILLYSFNSRFEQYHNSCLSLHYYHFLSIILNIIFIYWFIHRNRLIQSNNHSVPTAAISGSGSVSIYSLSNQLLLLIILFHLLLNSIGFYLILNPHNDIDTDSVECGSGLSIYLIRLLLFNIVFTTAGSLAYLIRLIELLYYSRSKSIDIDIDNNVQTKLLNV